MKKLLAVLLSSFLAVGLTGCASNSSNGGSASDGTEYTVAIIKQLDHASLDEIANAIAEELDKIASENGVTINYTIDSGNNDATTLQQYAANYVGDKVDCIIPIATLAAQTMAAATEGTDIPVLYAAISDPEGSELTGIENVSGTSDALNTNQIMDMMFEINKDIKNVGLLYSQSETNSEKPIADAKAYLENKNIAYVEATGNTDSEIAQAVSSLIASKVDVIFTPTDNVVMATEITTAEKLIEAGIPHYTGADSFVRNGAFTTCGVNYTELGYKTADLAYEAMTSGMSSLEDYYIMDGGIITVNTETAEALGIDYSGLSKYGEIVEVVTTEE